MQHQTLSTKIKDLNRDVESLRNELKAERLSKKRELQETLAGHKKQLAVKIRCMQELEGKNKTLNEELKMEKLKLISVQKASSTVINIRTEYTPSCYIHIHLCMQKQEREEQHLTLSSKNEELKKDVESLRNELEAERVSKERKLRKLTTEREEEVVEHKKQLASIRQELEAEKQKPAQQKVTHHIYLSV